MDNCSAEEHLGLQNGKRKTQHGSSAILVQIPIQNLTILANTNQPQLHIYIYQKGRQLTGNLSIYFMQVF